MVYLREAYCNSDVLVTGGLGFIGLNLTKALLDLGAKVTIVNRSLRTDAKAWLDHFAAGRPFTLHLADIRNRKDIDHLLMGKQVIFDLAGHSGAAQSLIESHRDMQFNVEGHLTLLESIRQQPDKPRVIFVSSRLVYGETGTTIVTEDTPTNPTSLYGLHKLTVEHYYRLYYRHYGVPYVVVRLTNPYGPYQFPDRKGFGIVNYFIHQALQGSPVTIYGDGTQLRDYIYIDDVIDALLDMGLHPHCVSQTFNLGQGSSIPLRDMAQMIVDVSGHSRLDFVPWPELAKKVETGDFLCSIAKLHHTLDSWQPRYQWKEGVQRTVEIYRDILGQVT